MAIKQLTAHLSPKAALISEKCLKSVLLQGETEPNLADSLAENRFMVARAIGTFAFFKPAAMPIQWHKAVLDIFPSLPKTDSTFDAMQSASAAAVEVLRTIEVQV